MFALLLLVLPAQATPCEGDIASTITAAQQSFTDTCCTDYDGSSGYHYCAWSTAGWQCAEHDWATPACTDPEPDESICTGTTESDLQVARTAYAVACGQPWNPTSGHHFCAWDAGWTCWGPGTGTPDDAPTCDQALVDEASALAPAQPVDLALNAAELSWRQIPVPGVPVTKWNVFRDRAYVTTVGQPRYTVAPADRFKAFTITAINERDQVHSRTSMPYRHAGPPLVPLDVVVDAWPAFPDAPRSGPLAGNWAPVFVDDFDGSGPVRPPWNFLRSENHRDTAIQNDRHANRVNGLLVMDTTVAPNGQPEMSFLRTVEPGNGIDTGPDGDDFLVDPTQGPVYVEASVRFDQAVDPYHHWWAFWLFVNNVDSDGVTYRAYDGDASTGSEIDILEYAPDVATNGFNAAIFTDHDVVSRPDQTEDGFAVANAMATYGIDLADGRFHKIGLLYTRTALRFYVDGHEFWHEDDQAFVTENARMGIHLTWEARDNSDGTSSFNPLPQYGECGGFRTAADGGRDGAVYVDHVRVHRMIGAGSGQARGADEADVREAGFRSLDGSLGCGSTPGGALWLGLLGLLLGRRRD